MKRSKKVELRHFRTVHAERRFYDMKQKKVKKLNVSRGNKKLVSNDKTLFLIWNLPAGITCPNLTPHCWKECYAKKAEAYYPTCKPSRMRNLEAAMQADFVERMTYTILSAIYHDRKHRKVIVRIHESGDFFSLPYAMAWLQIAYNLRGEKVKFIAYTKSFMFFDGVPIPKNMSLRASVWDDTKPEDLETIRRNGWNVYTAVEKFTEHDTFDHCRCEDCATCGQCWDNTRKLIACEIH